MTRTAPRRSFRTTLIATTALVSGLAGIAPAVAQVTPSNPSVGAGTPVFNLNGTDVAGAGVDGSSGTLKVTLNDQNTIVNWGAFDVGAVDIVNFDRAAGVVGNIAILNRDLSGTTSDINGTMTSDSGIAVYLLNPSGVIFGTGANVNVGALIAGSLGLTDGDFLNGQDSLTFNGPTGSTALTQILSGAKIATTGADFGQLALIGAQVDTAGDLTASGDVALVAATNVVMTASAGSPLGFTIDAGTTVATPVTASGTISGRNVTFAFATLQGVTDAVLSVAGTVTATVATASDKGIVLLAGQNTTGTAAPTVTVTANDDTKGAARIDIAGGLTLASTGGTGDLRVLSSGKIDAAGSIKAETGFVAVDAVGDVFAANVAGTTGATGTSLIRSSGGTTKVGAVSLLGGGLDIGASGLATSLTGDVTATGDIDLFGPVTLLADVTATANADGAINFASTVDGATFNLVTATGGLTTFSGAVTLNKLTVTGASAIDGGAVTTTDAQSYGGPVTLKANAATTLIGSKIEFSDVLGGETATLTTKGATIFGKAVTLANLTVDGKSDINGGTVATAGGTQSYQDEVTLGAGTILSGTKLEYTTIVGSGNDLALNFSDPTNIGPAISGVRDLSTGADGLTIVNGDVVTSGKQTYDDAVVLAATAEFKSTLNGAISFNNTLDGGFAATVTTGGDTLFAGDVGGETPLVALITDADGTTIFGKAGTPNSVNATDNLQFKDAVTLAADTNYDSAGTISFEKTVDGGFALTAKSVKATTFLGDVGAAVRLASLSVDADGGIVFGPGDGTIEAKTTKDQVYKDAVTLKADTTFDSKDGGAITFESTIDGKYRLAVNTGGVTTFGGAVGGTDALLAVTTDFVATDTTVIAGGSVTTQGVEADLTGDQIYKDAVVLNAATTFTSKDAGAITFARTIDSKANSEYALTIVSAGKTDITGAVGLKDATTILGAIKITAGDAAAVRDGLATVGDYTILATSKDVANFAAITLGNPNAPTTQTVGNKASLTATAGDIVVYSTLASVGDATLLAQADSIRLGTIDSKGLVNIEAAKNVYGVAPDVAGATGPGDIVIGTLTVADAIDIETAGNLRAGALTSVNSYIELNAQGAITGLGDATNLGAGGGKVTGTEVTVKAGQAAPYIAKLAEVTATTGDIDVSGYAVAVGKATAAGDLRLTDNGGGVYLGDGTAATFAVVQTGGTIDFGLTDESADLVAKDFGSADLTANKSYVDVKSVQSVVQLGDVTAQDFVTADAALGLAVINATAQTGALTLTTADGLLTLKTGSAGTFATLEKKGGDRELRVRETLTSGTVDDAIGTILIASSTDARLGTITARGGALTVTADGAATGVAGTSTATDPGFGRAVLASLANQSEGAVNDKSVTVTAGKLAQLGKVTAGDDVTVKSTTATVDVSSVTSARGGLTFEAAANALLGTKQASALPVSDTVADSSVATSAILIATTGDAAIGRVLTAGQDVKATAGRDIRLGTDLILANNTGGGGSITLTAARDVTGMADALEDLGEATVDASGQLRVGNLIAGTGATLTGKGDARLRNATATTGDLKVTAEGSITGLADPGAVARDPIAGAGQLRVANGGAGGIVVTASTGNARLSSVRTETGDITVTAGGHAAIGEADAFAALGVAAGLGVHVGQGASGATSTINADGTAIAVTTLGEATNLVALGFGGANLTATADTGSIAVTATTKAVQLGTVTAGKNVTANAGTAIAANDVTARTGALALTANNGALYLGTGAAGTTAELRKLGTEAVSGNELRVRTSLTSGTVKDASGTITIDSKTDARLRTVTAQGGELSATAANDLTGLLGSSSGLEPTYGRADLAAAIKTGGAADSDLSVAVTTGKLAQLGNVVAGNNITVSAGAGAVTLGAIDVSTVNARRGALTLTANNTGGGARAGVRLGVANTGLSDAVADSVAGAGAALRSTGAGDVLIGRTLTVQTSGASIRGDRNVRLAQLGTTTETVNVLAGDLNLTAAQSVLGLTPDAASIVGAGDFGFGSLDIDGGIALSAPGNLRIGEAASRTGSIDLDAVGAVTGRNVAGATTNVGGRVRAANVTVRAGTVSPEVARLDRVTAYGGAADIAAFAIDIGTATATGALSLTESGGGIAVGTTRAATLTVTSTGGTGGAGPITPATIAEALLRFDDKNALADKNFGSANLTASNGFVKVDSANSVVQLGTVAAKNEITANASLGLAAIDATSATGALTFRTANGLLALTKGSAGTTATLEKKGDALELRVRDALTAGTVANAVGTVAIDSATDARLGVVTAKGGALTIGAIGNVTGVAGTSTATDASFGRAVLASAGNGTAADRTVSVTAGKLIQLGAVTAGEAVTLAAGATTGTGAIDVSSVTSARGGLTATANNTAATGAAGTKLGDPGAGVTQVAQNVTLTANGTRGDMVIGKDVTAGGAITVTGFNVNATGNLNATGPATITLAGDLTATGVRGSTVGISAGEISVGSIVAGTTATTTGGTTSIGSLSAGTVASIKSSGRVTLGTTAPVTALSAQTLTLDAIDADLLGALALSSKATLTNTGTGGMRLGDGLAAAPATDFVLSAAEVSRVNAPNVTFANANRAVAIGQVDFGAASVTKSAVLTTGRIDVTGTVSAGKAANLLLQLGGSGAAAGQASVLRVAATAAGGGGKIIAPNATVELRGGAIGVGQDANLLAPLGVLSGQPVSGAQAASAFVSNTTSALYLGRYTTIDPILVNVANLRVSYSNFALFQNTTQVQATGSAGTIVSGTVNTIDLNATVPDNAFALFGTVAGQVREAAALVPSIVVGGTVNRGNSRINGCLIGASGGGCLIALLPTPSINLFDSSQVAIFATAADIAITFDPIVGSSNEALFSDLGTADIPGDDEPECDPVADPTCRREGTNP